MNKSSILKGKWIWNEEAQGNNIYVNFTRDFELEDIKEDAKLFISSDTEYVLWINGKFVSTGQYKDYPEYIRYDTIQISNYLKQGKNTLFVKVYYQGEASFQYSKGNAGLWFLLENGNTKISSDEKVLTCIAREYASGEIFKTSMQLGYGFVYDAREEKCGNFRQASVCEEKKFYPRPVKKLVYTKSKEAEIIAQGYVQRKQKTGTPAEIMYKDYLSHRTFEEIFEGSTVLPGRLEAKSNKDIYFLIDLKEERCGYLALDAECSEGAVIDIAYGQHLDDLRVRSSVGSRNFANRYICREGKQNFKYYFKRISGRYIQVHITGFKHLTVYNIEINRADYPFKFSAEFNCSDRLHNKIHDVCRETLACCVHEHYEDTPWREQALYASDSRNQMLFGYYTFAEFDMARSSIALLARGMKADAFIPMCAPSDVNICIPSFSFIWLLSVKEYTQFSGDITLAFSLWKQILYMLDVYTKDIENNLAKRPYGIRYWHYYEWSEGNVFDEPFARPATTEFEKNYLDGLYNAFLCIAIDSAIWIGEKLGKSEFCEKYTKILKKLLLGINKNFWNEEKALYSSCVEYGEKKNYSELMQALAILCGAAKETRAQKLRSILADKNNSLVKITLSYTLYKYEALLMEDSAYMESVLDDIAEKWGKMMFLGAVTVWELDNEDEMFGPAGSYCHGWSAVPIYVYYRYALGITPEFMRGETLKTEPYNAFFRCKGSVKTLKGIKEISYSHNENGKVECAH